MARYKGDILVLISTFCWGSSYFFIQMGLETFSVFNLVALRFGIACLVAMAVFFPALRRLNWSGAGYGLLLGFLLFIGNASLTYGLKNTTISNAGFLVATTVVFVAVMQTIRERSRPRPMLVLGLLLTMMGVGVLSLTSEISLHIGDILCLSSALLYATHIFVAERATRTHDAVGVCIVQFGGTSIFAWCACLLLESPSLPHSPREITSVLVSGVMGIAVGFICQLVGQKYTSPTRTAFIFTFEPLFAVLFAYLFANEVLTVRTFLGGALLLAGVYVSEYKKKTARVPSVRLRPE